MKRVGFMVVIVFFFVGQLSAQYKLKMNLKKGDTISVARVLRPNAPVAWERGKYREVELPTNKSRILIFMTKKQYDLIQEELQLSDLEIVIDENWTLVGYQRE